MVSFHILSLWKKKLRPKFWHFTVGRRGQQTFFFRPNYSSIFHLVHVVRPSKLVRRIQISLRRKTDDSILYNTWVDPCHLIRGLSVTWYSICTELNPSVHFLLYDSAIWLCARAFLVIYNWDLNKFILQSNDKDLLRCYIKQIMFFHSFNGAIIFLCLKIEHSIFALLNRMFNLSTHKNNGTIELINIV